MRRIAIGAIALLLAGCGNAVPTTADDKYSQSWSTDYASTTCVQMLDEMTEHERWVTAADLLSSARAANGVQPAMPTDTLVDAFAASLAKACRNDLKVVTHPTYVSRVAVGVYLLESETFGVSQ